MKNRVYAFKNAIKFIYPYVLRFTIVLAIITLGTRIANYSVFQVLFSKCIILLMFSAAMFLTYKILDINYPYHQLHDIDKRRDHSDKKRWWEL